MIASTKNDNEDCTGECPVYTAIFKGLQFSRRADMIISMVRAQKQKKQIPSHSPIIFVLHQFGPPIIFSSPWD